MSDEFGQFSLADMLKAGGGNPFQGPTSAVPENSAPLTASQAADLAHIAQQEQAKRLRESIQPALAYAYTEIRRAAGSPAGLTAVELSLKEFALSAEQLLALGRALERQGYKVLSHPASHRFTVGWHPAPVIGGELPSGIKTRGITLGMAASPGQSLLREGPQEVGPAE